MKDKIEKRVERKRKRSPVKGALIKGMSKKLPIAILESPVFEEGLKRLMKRHSGIYALYRGKKLYYVGLASRDLHWRIRKHTEDRHAGKWDSFMIFRIRRVHYLKDIETPITNITDTRGNRAKGHVPRDADLNLMLRNALKESERVTRGTKRALYH